MLKANRITFARTSHAEVARAFLDCTDPDAQSVTVGRILITTAGSESLAAMRTYPGTGRWP